MGKLASKIGKPLLADTHTIRKTILGAPQLLIELYPTKEPPTAIKFQAGRTSFTQEIHYEWFPRTCSMCNKWGHRTEECDLKKWERSNKGTQVMKQPNVTDPAVSHLQGKHEDEAGPPKREENFHIVQKKEQSMEAKRKEDTNISKHIINQLLCRDKSYKTARHQHVRRS